LASSGQLVEMDRYARKRPWNRQTISRSRCGRMSPRSTAKRYAAHRAEPNTQHAQSKAKKRQRLALHNDQSMSKRARMSKAFKGAIQTANSLNLIRVPRGLRTAGTRSISASAELGALRCAHFFAVAEPAQSPEGWLAALGQSLGFCPRRSRHRNVRVNAGWRTDRLPES